MKIEDRIMQSATGLLGTVKSEPDENGNLWVQFDEHWSMTVCHVDALDRAKSESVVETASYA